MTAIAIDYGDKRCGIAIQIENISIAKEIVPRIEIFSKIKKYIKEYNFSEIVVGLPYDLFGKDLKQLNKTKKFINKLKEIFPEKKIIGVDERFTSFEADLVLKEMGFTNTRNQKDDISAQLILETYLQNKNLAK